MTANGARGAPPRVLLVDDEPDLIAALATLLEDEGFSIARAGSGQEAQLLAGREHFDLVVSDWKMPGIDGLETLTGITETDPDTRGVLMTGYLSDDLRSRVDSSGFPCIEKPFEIEELLAVVGLPAGGSRSDRGPASRSEGSTPKNKDEDR